MIFSVQHKYEVVLKNKKPISHTCNIFRGIRKGVFKGLNYYNIIKQKTYLFLKTF